MTCHIERNAEVRYYTDFKSVFHTGHCQAPRANIDFRTGTRGSEPRRIGETERLLDDHGALARLGHNRRRDAHLSGSGSLCATCRLDGSREMDRILMNFDLKKRS